MTSGYLVGRGNCNLIHSNITFSPFDQVSNSVDQRYVSHVSPDVLIIIFFFEKQWSFNNMRSSFQSVNITTRLV